MLRRSWLLGLFVFAQLVAAHAPSAAQDVRGELIKAGTLVVGTTGTAPPFTFTGTDGRLQGFDVELAGMLAQKFGLQTEFVQLEFAGLLPGLRAGRYDIVASGVTRTPERLSSPDFVLLQPYIVNGVAITRRANDNRITGWNNVCGLRMGGVRGAVQPRIAREKLPASCALEMREYPGWTEMVLDLVNNRVDFLAMDFLGPNFLARQASQPVTVLPDIIEVITQSIAVDRRKGTLAAAIDAELGRYRADGTLQRLTEKWFGASLSWDLVK
jgi:ABC-type amino acid transport substrate-binding protein